MCEVKIEVDPNIILDIQQDIKELNQYVHDGLERIYNQLLKLNITADLPE